MNALPHPALDDLEPDDLDCDHTWELISDWMGDPSIPYGTCDCSYMECSDCGETREITDQDRRDWRDDAEYGRWEASQS